MTPEDVLNFWFVECEQKHWWQKSNSFDATIERRFGGVHFAASKGELSHWRNRGRGRLAEVIVLDQFSRNIFRDDPRSFACDTMALVLAQEAVSLGVHVNWSPTWKSFLFMPYMHSESLIVHEDAVELFSEPGLEDNLKFEHAHKSIIERFGRYPHRNEILGRRSTAEELAFLKEPGSSF